MSRYSSLYRISKGSGRCGLAALIGSLLAPQCLLPSAAFARSREQTTAFSFALSNCGQPKPGPSLLNSLQIVASDAYSNTSSASTSYQPGQLVCTVPAGPALCKDGQNQTVTENFTTTSAGQGFYTLFSFQTTDPQPYLTLNTGTVPVAKSPQNVSPPGLKIVSEVHCPGCGQLVRAEAMYCPVCRYHLAFLVKEPRSVAPVLPETENRAVSPVTPPGELQGRGMGDESGGAAIEVKLRNLWNRVGQ